MDFVFGATDDAWLEIRLFRNLGPGVSSPASGEGLQQQRLQSRVTGQCNDRRQLAVTLGRLPLASGFLSRRSGSP
jgi:hypothetical protein